MIEREKLLDGIVVVRTSEPSERLSADVERARLQGGLCGGDPRGVSKNCE
jgi:hypothetical protein